MFHKCIAGMGNHPCLARSLPDPAALRALQDGVGDLRKLVMQNRAIWPAREFHISQELTNILWMFFKNGWAYGYSDPSRDAEALPWDSHYSTAIISPTPLHHAWLFWQLCKLPAATPHDTAPIMDRKVSQIRSFHIRLTNSYIVHAAFV